MKRKGTLFIFSAPSGAGKDTVLAEVLKQNDNLKLSISNITRGMRQGEVEGEKYNFISKEKFEQMGQDPHDCPHGHRHDDLHGL